MKRWVRSPSYLCCQWRSMQPNARMLSARRLEVLARTGDCTHQTPHRNNITDRVYRQGEDDSNGRGVVKLLALQHQTRNIPLSLRSRAPQWCLFLNSLLTPSMLCDLGVDQWVSVKINAIYNHWWACIVKMNEGSEEIERSWTCMNSSRDLHMSYNLPFSVSVWSLPLG